MHLIQNIQLHKHRKMFEPTGPGCRFKSAYIFSATGPDRTGPDLLKATGGKGKKRLVYT